MPLDPEPIRPRNSPTTNRTSADELLEFFKKIIAWQNNRIIVLKALDGVMISHAEALCMIITYETSQDQIRREAAEIKRYWSIPS